MCGIFGVITSNYIKKDLLNKLVSQSIQRGSDSSGLYYIKNDLHYINRASYKLDKLVEKINLNNLSFIAGHSRLITNSSNDNQPVRRDSISVLHNGIIVNQDNIWEEIDQKPLYDIDSEVIPSLFNYFISQEINLSNIPEKIFQICEGVISCAVIIEKLGKLVLLSNNGSLYVGMRDEDFVFASEEFSLKIVNCKNIKQIKNDYLIIDIPKNKEKIIEKNEKINRLDYVPKLNFISKESDLLIYKKLNFKRCSKCILPETMPFIKFDDFGVCNFCKNYKLRNNPKPFKDFLKIVEPYRNLSRNDCIVPFSGGRDSSFA